jgi:hypothetical protein
MIAAVLLAILSVCSMAQTVEVTVPLASVTQADAPVQLTGMITALEDSATGHYEYRPKVTAKNGSPASLR